MELYEENTFTWIMSVKRRMEANVSGEQVSGSDLQPNDKNFPCGSSQLQSAKLQILLTSWRQQ